MILRYIVAVIFIPLIIALACLRFFVDAVSSILLAIDKAIASVFDYFPLIK